MNDRIVTAAVIIIGNEILSGRTRDSNLNDIASTLGEWGIRVRQARVIPDDEAVIVATVNELRAGYDYVFTTGGIGPTHDDITAGCIAKAFGVELVENPQIAAMIRRYKAPAQTLDSALRMAMIPQGAGLIQNATGGPPGFYMDNVFVMAGVPSIMRAMLQSLEHELTHGAVVLSRSIDAYLGESSVAKPLRKLQEEHPEVDIGSYPFQRDGQYGTSIVLRSTDPELLDRVEQQLRELLARAGS